MRSARTNAILHLMLLPAVLFTFVFSYIPMGGIVIAFQNFIPAKGLFGDQVWNGLDNFKYLLSLPSFLSALRNTLIIALSKMMLGLAVPIMVSLLLNEAGGKYFKRSIQTIIYLPHFISWVVLAGIFIEMLSPSSGIINKVLKVLDIEPIFFLGSNTWFRPTIIITDSWKNFGFSTIIYVAAISGVDPGLYESALMDGAGRIRQAFNITIPCISSTIILLSVLSMGNILNAGFDQIFNLYNPIVYQSGDIFDTFVYRMGIVQAQYGVATAAGLFKSAVSSVFICLSYFLSFRLAGYRIF